MDIFIDGKTSQQIVETTIKDTLKDQVIEGLIVSKTENEREFLVTKGKCYIGGKEVFLSSDTKIVGNVGDTILWTDILGLLHTGTTLPADSLELASFSPLVAGQPAPEPVQAPKTEISHKDLIDVLPYQHHKHIFGEAPVEVPSTGVQFNFSTSKVFKSGTLRVYVNGLRMLKGVGNDYTEDADLQGYTFVDAPATGSVIQHDYLEG